MLTLRIQQFMSGIQIACASFHYLKKHLTILLISAIAPVVSFFLSPLVFQLTRHINTPFLPSWLFTFLFSFLGLSIFNFIYLWLVIYNFRSSGYFPYYDQKIRHIFVLKAPSIFAWSAISAVISTLLTIASHQFHGTIVITFIFKVIDAYWWLINFLLIPSLADASSSLMQAIRWTLKTIYTEFLTLIGAGGTFYIIKHIANHSLYLIVLSTPRALVQTGLISLSPQEDAYTLLIMISIIGIILTSLCSIITFAIQSIIASNLYLKFTGRSIAAYEDFNLGKTVILALLSFLLFCIIMFMLSSTLMAVSWRVPMFGRFLISIFT